MRKTSRSVRPYRPFAFRPQLDVLEDRTLLNVGLLPDAFNRNTTANFGGNQTETTVAVNPNNANQIFAASNPMTFRWSNDGGVTWNNSNVAGLPASCCDNQATWDRHGNLFVVYLGGSGVVVARSINGGQTWGVIGNFGGSGIDQPSIDSGPGAAGSGFSDSVWITYRDTGTGDNIVARGAGISGLGTPAAPAFTAIQRAPGSASANFGDIAITNLGAVIVTYQTPASGIGPSTIRTNTDANGILAGGFNAGVNASATNVGGFAPITPQPSRTIDAEANLDCDHATNACYLVYVDRPSTASNDTNIFLRTSFNVGASWNAALRVNDDTGTNSQFNPAIDVDQSTGDVGITWYDARNAGAANNTVQVYGTVKFFGNANNWFWPNRLISKGTSSCITAGSFNCGDYDTGAFHNGLIYRTWTDNSVGGLTPANTSPPAQDMAMSRMRVDNVDVGGTLATALVTGVGPGPTTFFNITEPTGNDNNGNANGAGLRDVDMYRFSANAGTTVTIRTSLPPGGVSYDTVVRLFNSAGGQLAINDDDEPATDRYSRLTFTISTTGTYYVGVSGYRNIAYDPNVYGSGADGQVGDYRLDISLTGQPDIGDTIAAALNTGIGPLVGTYNLASEVIGNGEFNRLDVDIFRFAANAGQSVTISTALPAGGDSGDTILRLFNSAGAQLTSNDDCGVVLYSCIDNFVLPASTGNLYYIGVSAYNNGAYNPNVAGSGRTTNERELLGDYRLTLTLANGPVANFLLTQSVASTPAGTAFSVTVRARDLAGNTVTNYTGTVTFSSSDSKATLPANYTFVAADNGVRTFTNGVTLYVAGAQTVTVAQVGNPGINGAINHTVTFAAPYYYYVYQGDSSLPPPTVTRNVPFPIYILPFDIYFNWITNYVGTINFFSFDPLAVYPATYTFTGSEGGIGVPGNIRFGTLGLQDMYVYDTPQTAWGLGLYNVIGPDGSPGPGGNPGGGEAPGAADAVDLLEPPARLARPDLPNRFAAPTVPALDRQAIDRLFTGLPTPLTPRAVPSRIEPVAARSFKLFDDEPFRIG